MVRDVWPPQPSGGQWGFGELWGHPMNPLCCCPKRNQGLAFKPLQHHLGKCVEMRKNHPGPPPFEQPLGHSSSLKVSVSICFQRFYISLQTWTIFHHRSKIIISWNYVKIKPTKPMLSGKLVIFLIIQKESEWAVINSTSKLLLGGKIWTIKNMEKICTREW